MRRDVVAAARAGVAVALAVQRSVEQSVGSAIAAAVSESWAPTRPSGLLALLVALAPATALRRDGTGAGGCLGGDGGAPSAFPPALWAAELLSPAHYRRLLVSYVLQLLASAVLYASLAPQQPRDFLEAFLPYALLLASGEAWLEGMIVTVLVVYVPGAVKLFDEAWYLRRQPTPPA